MLPNYFDYIFVFLTQKVRLRPELSPKFLSTLGPNPTRKVRPDLLPSRDEGVTPRPIGVYVANQMRVLHYSVVMKRELSKKAKLSIFKAVFVPIFTYGHGSWVMTKRMRSQVQASEMRFLRRIERVTLFNKVRSSKIRKSLNIEPLLLRIEKSQLRWFGHVSRMPQERLPKQALHAKANGRRPVGRPRTRWTDYIEGLGWDRLGLRPSEMMEVMEDREVWRLNLEPLPSQPEVESSRTHFEVLGLGLEASSTRKLACPRLEDSTIF